MHPSRGKTIAIFTAAVGLAALVACAILCRNQILEMWYVRDLRSSELPVRKNAAARLGEIGSRRAAKALLEILEETVAPAPRPRRRSSRSSPGSRPRSASRSPRGSSGKRRRPARPPAP